MITMRYMDVNILVTIIIFINLAFNSHAKQRERIGLLTVTYARNHNYSIFTNYTQHYTQMQCYADIVSEINIVWNNESPPQDIAPYNKQQSTIPINYYHTPANSLNHRFQLPNNSQATILYSLDDDIMVDCATLNQTYQRYLSHSDISPRRIISNEVRSF